MQKRGKTGIPFFFFLEYPANLTRAACLAGTLDNYESGELHLANAMHKPSRPPPTHTQNRDPWFFAIAVGRAATFICKVRRKKK